MSDETFPWVETINVGVAEHDGHVGNIQIASWMYDAWLNYLTKGLQQDPEKLFGGGGRPIVREITARFNAEIFAGDVLHCGVRALSRRHRSFTLQQVLSKVPTGDVVAVGTTVLVTIDTATHALVEVPTDLWRAVEHAEGRSIPIEPA